VPLRLSHVSDIFVRFPKIEMERGKKFCRPAVADAFRTSHRFLIPLQSERNIGLMASYVMRRDAALKVIHTLLPRLDEERRSLIDVSFAFLLHALHAELHNVVVGIHEFRLSRCRKRAFNPRCNPTGLPKRPPSAQDRRTAAPQDPLAK
jgi:hypothetical protein